MSYFKGIGNKTGSYTGKKLPLIGLLENKKHTIFNEYVSGSGVGASNIVTRRLKKKRSKITKCKQIKQELNRDDILIIQDDITNYYTIEKKINDLPLETTINLGNNNNINVDTQIFMVQANKIINALNNIEQSFTFTTNSEYNLVENVASIKSENIDTLLSNENNIIRSSTVINETPDEINTENIQMMEHTFINKGIDNGKQVIDYIIDITVFTSL